MSQENSNFQPLQNSFKSALVDKQKLPFLLLIGVETDEFCK